MKAVKNKDAPFDYTNEDKMGYSMLKMLDCPNDEIVIVSLACIHPYLTMNFIQRETNWIIMRNKRVLN